ncbi:hypothetical protein CJU89_4613 [Yarrowia sp. B02]|nr:hypothetical protein CJU89_4613 [Yarrowia sp. B02]
MDTPNLSIPEGISDELRVPLEKLIHDFKEGDITAKGYQKRREQLIAVYVQRHQHSRSTDRVDDSPSSSRPASHHIYSLSKDLGSASSPSSLAQHEEEELLMPLEPREIPDTMRDPHNTAVAMAKFDNLPSILRHRAKTNAAHTAIITLDDAKGKDVNVITWEKLASKAERVAQMIRDKSNLYRADRVALLYQDSEVVEFAVAILGCFLAGVVAVPINPFYHFKDTTYVMHTTQIHLALTTEVTYKIVHKHMVQDRQQWPKGVEWWKTNEFGSYQKPKHGEMPALQVPDLAYIEFSRSPTGDLRGVVMSHRTIIHQMTCLTAMLKSRNKFVQPDNRFQRGDVILSSLDSRQSIGLIMGVLLTVYTGSTLVWIPHSALAVPGLYANAISRHKVTILLSDYPALKQVAYNYQSFPQLTRAYSKKQQVNLASVNWCLIDAATVDTEFNEILADRWLRPLGNKHAYETIAPLLTLTEHGGMVISMRDWLGGQEKLGKGSALTLEDDDEDDGPYELSKILLDKPSLTTNNIRLIPPVRGGEDSLKHIRVGAFGYPLPDSTLAIVNPETRKLLPKMVVGEIWIDSPCLSGGFWGMGPETDMVFHARCYGNSGMLDLEFLRTGLLGFIYGGKVYVLGLYEDRLRQRYDPADEDDHSEKQSLVAAPPYRYHYTSHLVYSLVRKVPNVFDCSAFDIYLNEEHLPVAILESTLAEQTPINPGGPARQLNYEALDDLARGCIAVLQESHKVRVFCVLITAPHTLPRTMKNGRSEIGNMLCKRRFSQGLLPAVYCKFGIIQALKTIPCGQDPEGGIWSSAISHIRSDYLGMADKQYSGIELRDVVRDDRTSTPLSAFGSLVEILQWRVAHQADELAYSTIQQSGKEGKALSWKKFDQRVSTVCHYLKNKVGLKQGDHALLLYTHSEDFVVAVYACMALGIVAVPMPPLDSGRLHEDIPAYCGVISEYKIKAILVNSETETSMKAKLISQQSKQIAAQLKVVLPKKYNTSKPKLAHSGTRDLRYIVKPEDTNRPAVVWLTWSAEHRRSGVMLTHRTLMGMCKVQKETCQMASTKPVVGCVRSTSGIGFLHTCALGVYLGASTYLVSPIDYTVNPLTLFLAYSRYKVKDVYSTPQMLDYACATLKPKGFSLAETLNMMIAYDGRPRVDLAKNLRMLFLSTQLSNTAISSLYCHTLNPMVASRSYMGLEPIDLWLDPIALRQGYISVVNPENYPNALHVHDSGMVPVGTRIAIVNPETRELCKVGEFGEIWVWSEGNVHNAYPARDEFDRARFQGKLGDESSEAQAIARQGDYVRTGDLGFLHTVSRSLASGGHATEMQTLFVLGSLGATFESLGLSHFPQDVENTIEGSHRHLCSNGAVVFQAADHVIAVCEVTTDKFLASLVPVIASTVLDEHQLIINVVAFIPAKSMPKSRLGEKQRGKVLSQFVSKKLKTLQIFGVCEGQSTVLTFMKKK